MVGYGLQYYLARDMRPGGPVLRELFIAELRPRTAPSTRARAASGRLPRSRTPDLDRRQRLPQEPVPGRDASPGGLLRPRYRLSHVKHVTSLTVFLLTRAAPGRGPGPFGPLPPPPYSGAQPGELGRHIHALAREGAP